MNIYQFHSNPESLDLYEELLTKIPKLAFEHALSLGRRFPEGEEAIAKDALYAYQYAEYVIRGRFPEGEAAIAKSAVNAYMYANGVIKGRWPKAETEIAKKATFAYAYARDVIKGRFPEGEAAIADSFFRHAYEKKFNVQLYNF